MTSSRKASLGWDHVIWHLASGVEVSGDPDAAGV
jgi:hypothetical protein